MFKMLSKKWLNRFMVGAVHNQVYKIIFGVAYSRRSVSRGAVQKTAREKIKKARREEAAAPFWPHRNQLVRL